MTATERLAEAALSALTVTVTRKDGKTFTGQPVPYADEFGREAYSIRTGRRGRPAIVLADDVQDVAA
jgi:hypothetical protein